MTTPRTEDGEADTEQALREQALRRFLDERGLGSGTLALTRIGDGRSNLTYMVQRSDRRVVVRMPPPPPVPPGVHDVMREVRVLSQLQGVPAPKILASSADDGAIGVPFYVMEYIDGWVLTDDLPAAFAPANERRRIGEEVVDALAALHEVDVQAIGLGDFGRAEGFVERQLARSVRLWEASRTDETPLFDAVAAWLHANLRPARHTGIVHSDFRLGNVMFAREAPARLVAVLDWELAALGDQMVDVGYLSAFWVQPDDPRLRMFELGNVLRLGGFGTREDMVSRYAGRTGRSMEHLRFYEVFALFRLAAMMQANFRRGSEGAAVSEYFRGFATGAAEMIERAAWLAWGHEGGG